jgi:hypothetical protein
MASLVGIHSVAFCVLFSSRRKGEREKHERHEIFTAFEPATAQSQKRSSEGRGRGRM